MKEQVQIPPGGETSQEEDQAEKEPHALDKPEMPKGLGELKAKAKRPLYRCTGQRVVPIGDDVSFEFPCPNTSEDPSKLCHPEIIGDEDEGTDTDAFRQSWN